MKRMMSLVVLAGVLLSVFPSLAAADGWSWSTLNPRRSWKKLLGQSPDNVPESSSAADAQDEPTFFEKVDFGTRAFFARATGVFTHPHAVKPVQPAKQSGGWFARSKPAKKKPAKSSWLGSREPDVPQTIDEFMQLKRPEAL